MADEAWKHTVLPDGRTVELVDCVAVERDGPLWVIDVTVLIDGVNVGTHRVRISEPGQSNG